MYIKNCSQFYYPKNSTVNEFELRNCTSVKTVNHILMAKSKVPITGRCSISDEGRSSSYTPIYCRLLWSSARETNPGLARPGRDMPSIQQYIKPKSYPSHISIAKYSFQKMYRQRQYVMIIPIIKRLFVWGLLTKLFTFHMSQFVRREKRKRQTDRQTGKRERGESMLCVLTNTTMLFLVTPMQVLSNDNAFVHCFVYCTYFV